MKKLFLLFAGLFCAQAVFAASTTTKNTMKMVAYFPVPYVAYDTVSATQTMDVGVLKKCEMSLGENQSNLGGSNCSLFLYGAADGADDSRRGMLNVSGGKLNLNATGFADIPLIKSTTVLVGNGGQPSYGLLEIGKPGNEDPDFNALYIGSLANSGDSLRVIGRGNTGNDMAAKVTEFKMFAEIANNFPACNGTVTWQELELGGNATNNKTYKDVYLVCGNAEPAAPDPEPEPELTCANYDYKFAHKSECCPKMPKSDGVCWTESFVWGPIKAISGNFTMRYGAASRVLGGDRCYASVSPLVDTLVSPEQLNDYTSGFMRCPGKDSSQVKGQQCVPTTDIGPGITAPTRCLYADYTTANALSHAYYVGFQGCTVKSEWNGDYCDCKASSWAGHECISNGFKKNGW